MTSPPEEAERPEEAEATEDAARRAARLLRWYPRSWRDRYGAEFAELLMADIAEWPRSRARALDVARGAALARLAAAGLTGFPAPASPADGHAAHGQAARAGARASLSALGC
ncbi:MAG TPA: hypothetical protein VKG80_06490, partial [Trebonia sp.]|nr:hypothetical protein [Trebonia sp.]